MIPASTLPIDTSVDADGMAEAIFGSGIKIVSAKYTGDPNSSGVYSGGDENAPGITPSDTGVILSTGYATDVTNESGDANIAGGTSTDTEGVDGDEDLDDIAGFDTYDAAIFEAKFIPDGSTLTMQVVFSSEEYLEYVGSGFNDAVGVYVNDVKAELTVGDGDISINNINPDSNGDLYIDNPAGSGAVNTEMDGLTVTLTLKAPVTPGKENTIKIGIADAGDSSYDSNLMIAANSVQTAIVAGDDEIALNNDETQTLDVLGNDVGPSGAKLVVTAINGVAVEAGDTITLPSGVDIKINGDGTLEVSGADTEGENSFSYTVSDGTVNNDVGFVTVTTTVPCFVAGTPIDTARGPIPVEHLCPGDLVLTRDHGYQRIRWAGARNTVATGAHAPVRIAAGTFGDHGPLTVSPQHRVLVETPMLDLYFATSEVLVAAAHLVTGGRITRQQDASDVTYHHLLFDRHEVLRSNGIWSESYLPGPLTMASATDATRRELMDLFPDLDPVSGEGFGPAARMCLRRHEAGVLHEVV